MDPKRLDSCSTKDLARACAQQASRRRAPAREPAPCYELFCRAFAPSPDEDAWQAILNQYRRLVSHWLGQHASEDTIQDVFLRFWKAQQDAASSFTAHFSNIGAVMGYLKRCAVTVRIEAGREAERQHRLWERLRDASLVKLVLARAQAGREHTDSDYKQLMLSRLKDEKERAVFEGTYYYSLTPREIQAMRPDLFPDAKAVSRVKENLLKRLRRDRELEEYWNSHRGKSDSDGGKTACSPV